MKAILLCAGLGTRLGPMTEDRPKALLPVGDRPLIARVLEWLEGQGVTAVLINLHHLPEAIPAAVGDETGAGVPITYVHEEVLLGTAGTVRANAGWVADDDVLVVYGDVVTDQALQPLVHLHRSAVADATLLVHRRPGSNSALTMDPDGRITGFAERPPVPTPEGDLWVFSGVQVLSPRLVAQLPTDVPCDLPADVYAPRAGALRLFGVPLTGRRVAVDSPARLAEAQAVFGSPAP